MRGAPRVKVIAVDDKLLRGYVSAYKKPTKVNPEEYKTARSEHCDRIIWYLTQKGVPN